MVSWPAWLLAMNRFPPPIAVGFSPVARCTVAHRGAFAEHVVPANPYARPRGFGVEAQILGGKADAAKRVKRVAGADGCRSLNVNMSDQPRAAFNMHRPIENATWAYLDVFVELHLAAYHAGRMYVWHRVTIRADIGRGYHKQRHDQCHPA